MELDKDLKEYYQSIYGDLNTIEFTADKKNSLYIPLFSNSIDHSLSIHSLDKQELPVSAYALARPMIECYLRAMWVKYYLQESQIEEGCERLHFPTKLGALLLQVDSVAPEDDMFRRFKPTIEPIITNMHDFTHGGIQSIARQYGDNGDLSSPLSREERDELLQLATLTSSLSYEKLTPFIKSSRSPTSILHMASKLLKL